MNIGTRWRAGAEAPHSLPDAVIDGIREVEAALDDADAQVAMWTLTWLEGRPYATLDDGTVVTIDAAGGTEIRSEADGEAAAEEDDDLFPA